MDTESLMDAALVFGTGIDNTWSFIFTVVLGSVGFLATMRQVLSPDQRGQRRYRALIRLVQILLLIFLVNGFVALRGLFLRQNAVLAAIQDRAAEQGAEPELLAAFTPYVVMPEWLRDCPADPAILCDLNLPISMLVFVPGSLLLILFMPLIGGREKASGAN